MASYELGQQVEFAGTYRKGCIVGTASWLHPITGSLEFGYIVRLDQGEYLEGPRDVYITVVHQSGIIPVNEDKE